MHARRLIPFLAATAAALAAAAPANAQNTLEQSATGHNLGNPLSSTKTSMIIRCTATASSGAVRTRIDECYLRGLVTGIIGHAEPIALPDGPLAISTGRFQDISMDRFSVCVRSTATFSDGQTIARPLECFTA